MAEPGVGLVLATFCWLAACGGGGNNVPPDAGDADGVQADADGEQPDGGDVPADADTEQPSPGSQGAAERCSMLAHGSINRRLTTLSAPE